MDIFLSAFLGALLSTLPIGPINFVLMQFALSRRWEKWISCVVGVLCADAFYCFLSLRSFAALEASLKAFERFAPLSLALILTIFGLGMIFRRSDKQRDTPANFPAGQFFFGFLATLAQPALGLFWLSWWSVAHLGDPSLGLVASGLMAGDLIIFSFYAFLAKLFPKPDFSAARKLSQGVGWLLIVSAVFLILHWSFGGGSWAKV